MLFVTLYLGFGYILVSCVSDPCEGENAWVLFVGISEKQGADKKEAEFT